MRVNRNLIFGEKPTFGDPVQIGLQKAAEAGVQNFYPVAFLKRRFNENAQAYYYQVKFYCKNLISDPHRLTDQETCYTQIKGSLTCPDCGQQYFANSEGHVFFLPTPTEE